MAGVTPFIWFKGNAEEAMNYYVSLFPGSNITHIERYSGDQGIPEEQVLKGRVLTGVFEIMGTKFMCLDGPSVLGFDLGGSAISFLIEFDDQDALDKVWDKLVEDGGKPQQCGWIVDIFGVTWQIVPASLGQMMGDPNASEAQKKALSEAMMPMVKLDGPKLEEAFNSAK
jgi:predicted 3-demethylubiquinone-9 3-methyltransferase (glyoxalase superfamily)